MQKFDQIRIRERLSSLSRSRRCLFAALCAERLYPLFVHYSGQSNPEQGATLRVLLDRIWTVLETSQSELLPAWSQAEALVPDEDDEDWTAWSGYAQNAASAVAYAISAWADDSAESAGFAACQVYEAADSAAQNGPNAPENRYLEESVVSAQPIVQAALAGLEEDLVLAEQLQDGSVVRPTNNEISARKKWAGLLLE